METFHKEISDLTIKNAETRLELERQEKYNKIENIKIAIEQCFRKIMDGEYKEIITENARRGYNRCTICKFESNTVVNDFPFVFLLKGPRIDNGLGYGKRYFESQDICPLITRLKAEFCPFDVVYGFDKKQSSFTIDVIW